MEGRFSRIILSSCLVGYVRNSGRLGVKVVIIHSFLQH